MDFDQELDRAASAFPDITDDFDPTSLVNSKPTAVAPPPADDFGGWLDSANEPAEVKVTGDADDVVEKFESQFPELDDAPAFTTPAPAPQPTLRPSFLAAAAPPPTSVPAAIPAPLGYAPGLDDDDDEEPEVVRQWREKQEEDIASREAAAAAKKAETIKKAHDSIDSFYENYNKQKERSIRQNKEDEAKFLDSLTASLSEGTTWSRICALVDLENSQSKTLARAGPGTTDLSRYKEVLIRLRREDERAPGAAGY